MALTLLLLARAGRRQIDGRLARFAYTATLLAQAAVLGVAVSLWKKGPLSDRRLLLQLAAVPVAALLLAVRAYTYELSLWLPSAWLLVRYTRESGRARWTMPWLLLGAWWQPT